MGSLTIGEVARLSRVNLETIRYYERRGLLPDPPRAPSGYRQFAPDTVQRIHFIKHAQELGFTLNEIRDLLRLRVDPGRSCAEVRRRAEVKLAAIEQKLRTLTHMKRVLRKITAACARRGSTGECPILESLAEEKSQ
ncbi:MAG: MerR family DNA-binding protein [Acidobacteria bacterium]|nr:MerR family DNA-binding protein [Acidobacteriota bacterium]